eukprot:Skav210386  [mRNA]  locus=scaffold1526:317589:317996:- [translate_table: standard]
MELLRKLEAAQLHHVSQWRWGAPAVKPTGLLAVGFSSFMKSLWLRATNDPPRLQGPAIGKNHDGSFRTNRLKEYPSDFSAALAGAVADSFDQAHAKQLTRHVKISDPAAQRWVEEAAQAARHISTGSFLPDYQGG